MRDMDEKIDDKLITWNTILEEITVDTQLMIKDLLTSINYVAASGILVIILALYVLLISTRYGNIGDPGFLAISVFSFICPVIVGLYNLNKYIQLRSRYIRLSDLYEQLKK
jgi:hypothetical protein